MNRMELILATAIVLLAAFALGWFTYWLLHRFTRVAGGDIAEMDLLAQALHEAEETRDQAILYLEQREAELMEQAAQTEAVARHIRQPERRPPRGRRPDQLYRADQSQDLTRFVAGPP